MPPAADPTQYAREKEAFFELDALPAVDRAQRLTELAAKDPEFAALLSRRFEPSARQSELLDRVERAFDGPQLAHYYIVRELGRGGMGRVWLAERLLDNTRQQVALKQILHSHWDDEDLRRFQRERRILATLDHPNIAALLDGGRDNNGAPYLATKFVDGLPLDRWCREQALPIRARVQLIRDIANAVAHAHSRLVVHRDLKPANILVTADGRPTLLDFGIARLVGEQAITTTGPSQLTLRYAAPEQVQHAVSATGVGVDIYALGVLLYELIGNHSPYGEQATTAALLHAILTHTPPAPSRLGKLQGQGDRDLDAICLRALRKRPEDRYVSADAFAADLDRWLHNAPVDARRGERGYRMRAFVRNRWKALLTVALIALGAGGFLAYHIAQLDRQLAETQRERDKARAIASYFQELFASANPGEERSGQLTARELLARSVARLDQGDTSNLDDDARASMYHAAGRIMHVQGLNDEAAHMLDRAVALWLLQPKVPEDEVADAMHERARVDFGRGRYGDALALLRKAIARRAAIKDDRSTALGTLLQTTAVTERMLGRYAQASATLAKAIEVLHFSLPESQSNYAIALGNLGTILIYDGHLQEGHDKLKVGIDELLKLTPERTEALLGMQRNFAMSLRELGRFDEAEVAYQKNLKRLVEFYSPNHTEVARSHHSLAQMYLVQGRLDAAAAELDAAERAELVSNGADNPRMLAYLADRARILIARGDFKQARKLLDSVVAQRDASVISERGNASADRAAFAYAACRAEPAGGHLPALISTVAQMHQDPPQPRALIAQADQWITECRVNSAKLDGPAADVAPH